MVWFRNHHYAAMRAAVRAAGPDALVARLHRPLRKIGVLEIAHAVYLVESPYLLYDLALY